MEKKDEPRVLFNRYLHHKVVSLPEGENDGKLTSGLESSSSESMGHPVWNLQGEITPLSY